MIVTFAILGFLISRALSFSESTIACIRQDDSIQCDNEMFAVFCRAARHDWYAQVDDPTATSKSNL